MIEQMSYTILGNSLQPILKIFDKILRDTRIVSLQGSKNEFSQGCGNNIFFAGRAGMPK
jgi:hypothetical protein